jgi:hypothetical protein
MKQWRVLAAMGFALAGWLAWGQQAPPAHREAPDDPYRPNTGGIAPAGGNVVQRGPYVSRQVNVSATGANITGDAANEPSIAMDPTNPNRLVIAWRQFDTITSNFRQAGWAYSHDGGLTWTFPGVLEPGVFRSDPVVRADSNGVFYYMSLRGDFTCQVFLSRDGGVTFPERYDAYGGDKEWFTIDLTGGIGHGNLYLAWSTAASSTGNRIFTRSTNGGTAWMNPISIPSSPIWGTLAVDADGTLYIGGVSSSQWPDFYLARSSNAHDRTQTPTFDLYRRVELNGRLVYGAGPNPGGLLGQVWIGVDRSGGAYHGRLYFLCSVDPPGIDPQDVYLAFSPDRGATWSAPIRVNDDPPAANAWQWFGTLAVAPNGRVDVIWYDTRNDPNGLLSELRYTYSYDGGTTWAPSIPISPAFHPHVGWPNQNKIGDYIDMIALEAETLIAYAATFNGEQDVYFVRVGDCNGNGIHDGLDIAERRSTDRNRNQIPDECETRPGDVNFDGCVNDADLLAVLFAFGQTGSGLMEDLDGDGEVDDADLLEVLFHFGDGC